jgi:hypothetical protein
MRPDPGQAAGLDPADGGQPGQAHRVDVLGVAWLRIASAAAIFAVWRRPWRAFARLDRDGRRTLLAWVRSWPS